MKKVIRRALALMLVLGLTLSLQAPAMAADDKMDNPYISIMAPAYHSTYYIGETISYQFSIRNPFASYLCKPFVQILTATANPTTVKAAQGINMAIGSSARPTGTFTTSDLRAGDYFFVAIGMPISPTTGAEVSGQQQTAGYLFYIKDLKAPTSLKATVGKKKVTLTYKKAAGAQRYYIYRSTKKNSGYSCIGKTTALKYVDKTAKTGKRYYYKVRCMRTKYGKVKSPLSKPVRCAKVK